ncbi:hypothetical protein [uncultured Corynebacterium sp.]|mgnify:CR=1 FL=1|uniref:hypothetical protein n=1 Tax=uncultured Corynebacterium sp. TaxID=159447 RepID=UPI0025DF2926|nr:hypothetical protein [uncultured Corynebacterium sp.]
MQYLIDHGLKLNLTGKSRDFQTAYRNTFDCREEGLGDYILILTRHDDSEVDQLSLSLAALGIPMVRLNSDDVKAVTTTEVFMDGTMSLNGYHGRPRLVWRRHFAPEGIPVSQGVDQLERIYVQNQVEALGDTLTEVIERSINGDTTARTRLNQLRVARECGFEVLSSWIGLQPSTPLGAAIAKPIGTHWVEYPSHELTGVMPKVVGDGFCANLEKVPVLLQEYLEIEFELRVFVAGEKMVAISIWNCADARSLWLDNSGLEMREEELDPKLESLIRNYCERTKTELCAIDFVVSDGYYYFLEANVLFDWVFYERLIETNVISELFLHWIAKEFALVNS